MDLDYEKLGFKAGIEIHQELNTKKLFCNCQSSMNEKNKVSETKRNLRAVAGETGEVDAASFFEQGRERNFIYSGYEGESCLVDIDEEPPHEVDQDALHIALGVAKVLRLNVPDSICVMRKTVTDGSSVSGFQRTMIIGLEGKESYLDTSKGKVKILQLNLEEDSCKIEKKEGNDTYYSLSRQGIPLLEIGTDPSLKDPAHVKEAASKIGNILRSFNVKRGIGTIRQDVNISIAGGTRIEVKGWQDLRKIEELVKNEVLRQYNLLEIKKELEKRGLKKFKKNSLDATKFFEGCKSKIIQGNLKKGGVVHALLLPKFNGLLKKEICEGKTFGRELSEYAKAYGTKGMIHTDEDLKKYDLEKEFSVLKKQFLAKEEDLIIIIAESEDITSKALDAVYKRALFCLEGVPDETRIPNHDTATSSYARPLPGAHRMYPETDVPNIRITKKLLDSVNIPEMLEAKIKRYSKEYKIDENLAKEIIRGGFDYESYLKEHKNIDPKFIAFSLIDIPKEIKKRYGKEIEIEDHISEIFSKLDSGEIGKDAVLEILVEIAEGKTVDYSRFKVMSDSDLEKEIKKIISENKGIPSNALIGKVMAKLRGKADGKKIVDIVRKIS